MPQPQGVLGERDFDLKRMTKSKVEKKKCFSCSKTIWAIKEETKYKKQIPPKMKYYVY